MSAGVRGRPLPGWPVWAFRARYRRRRRRAWALAAATRRRAAL